MITSQKSFIRFVWRLSSRGPHMHWLKINTASSWIRCELTNTTDASHKNDLFPLIQWSELWRRMVTRAYSFSLICQTAKEKHDVSTRGLSHRSLWGRQTDSGTALIQLKLLVSQASPLIYLVLLNIGKLFFIIGALGEVPRKRAKRLELVILSMKESKLNWQLPRSVWANVT